MSESDQRPAENAPESPLDSTEPGTSRQTENITNNTAGGGEVNMATTPTPAADASATSTPPAHDANADRIQIIVKDQTGNQVGFALKSNTRMSKVMNAYADRQGRNVRSLRFFFDGDRVLEDSTPTSLSMQQDDIIEVSTEQLGGGPGAPKPRFKKGKKVKRVKDKSGTKIKLLKSEDDDMEEDEEEVMRFPVMATKVGGKPIARVDFKLNQAVKMKTLKKAWAKHTGIKLNHVVFRWNEDKEGPGLPVDEHDHIGRNLCGWGDPLYVSVVAEDKNILDEYAESRSKDPRGYHLTHKVDVIFNNDTLDIIGLESGDQLIINDGRELLFLDLAKV